MAFKTKEEMFGDGGAHGAAVPVDTSNPAGTGSGNRGIQFGEQLTAAIANRTHWALALNDEDLNTRLVAFETGGLNGAYDNGAVGPSGGGRDVTKDAGAIETVSSHSAVSGDTARDNAHFRANALADTAGASVGFDFVARRVGGSGQSGNDAVAGFVDRRAFAKAAGLTQLTSANAATLNPGGALPTTARLSSGQFHSGGNTDLSRSYDLIEISGGTAADGLYIFSNTGALTTDAILEALDGSAPAFPADTACTITVYRVQFGSFGSFGGRGKLLSALAAGMPNAISAFDFVPGKNQSDASDGGSDRAFRVMRKAGSGSTFEAMGADYLGRVEFSLNRADIIDEVDKNTRLGNYMIWRSHGSNPGVGAIVHSVDATITERYDYMSLVPYSPSVVPAITPNTGVTMTFTANSPVTGELLFNAPQDANLSNYLFGVGMFVEISGAGTANGLYYAAESVVSGNQGFLLRKADGAVPAHFPTSGTCTLVGVYAASGIGRVHTFPNASALTGSPATVTAHNILSGGPSTDSASLAIFMPNQVGGGSRAFVRMFSSSPASGDNFQEKFAVDTDGTVRARSAIYSGEGSASGGGFIINTTNINSEFKYGAARSRFKSIDLSFATYDTGGVAFGFNGNLITLAAASAIVYLPITPFIPEGGSIVAAEVVYEGQAGGDAKVAFATWESNWAAYPSVPTSTYVIGTVTTQQSTSSKQTIRHAPGSPPSISNETKRIVLAIFGRTGGAGDKIHGVRIQFNDPGPRNF